MEDDNVSKTAQESLRRQKQEAPKPLPASSSQIRVSGMVPGFQKSSKKKRAAEQISGEWSAETAHTEKVSLPSVKTRPAALASKRVQKLHLKGPQDTLREMVRLKKAASQKMGKVSKTTRRQKETAEVNQDQLWRDLLKPQEERLFQIDRSGL